MRLLILLLIFLVSCNSNDSKHDADTVPDKDTAVIDSDKNDSAPDESGDTDTVLPDPDSIADTDMNDSDFIDDCNPKLIDAPFPYYDKDGNITFCRPGCDNPTEKDPQCMSNLWREQNYNLCHQHPEYDCCGYPCVLESLKPMTKEETDKELVFDGKVLVPMHKCDLYLSVWSNDGTHGVVKSWNMSEGKVGFHLVPSALDILEWPVKRKAVTYNIATKKYSLIAPASNEMQSYYKGSRIIMSGDKRSLPIEQRKNYIVYMKDDGYVKVVFPGFVDNMPYEPALNDKWVFANIREPNQSSKMLYAKVGEWKWTVLGEGYGWEPGIVDNTLAVVDDNVNGWICDLSKRPQSITDCKKVNRAGEYVRGIRINKSDETKFVYNSNIMKLVSLELKDGVFSYTDLITEFTNDTQNNAYSLAALEYKNNILLFEEIVTDGSKYGGLLCYYRTDKNKKYCMKKMDKDEVTEDGTVLYPYGYAEFEGKWLLYQKRSSTPLILRDMDCYCKEEGVCPFEE